MPRHVDPSPARPRGRHSRTTLPRCLPAPLFLRALLLLAGTGLLLAGPAPAEELTAEQLYVKLACAYCHGADGRTPRWDTYPIIAGQTPRYTALALKAYQTGERGGLMSAQHAEVNDLLSENDIQRLADYLAALK